MFLYACVVADPGANLHWTDGDDEGVGVGFDLVGGALKRGTGCTSLFTIAGSPLQAVHVRQLHVSRTYMRIQGHDMYESGTTTYTLVGSEGGFGAVLDVNVGEEILEINIDWLRVHWVLTDLEGMIKTEDHRISVSK